MSKYKRPQDVQAPSQGSWGYVPEVRIFSDTDYSALQTSINLWLVAQTALPYTSTITRIDFDTASPANNVMQYSALIHYTITRAI